MMQVIMMLQTLHFLPPGASGSLSANKDLVLDGVKATVSSINSDASNGYYKINQTIPIKITFSEAVNVVGTPQLTLETGASDAVVNYTSGTGTNELIFNYTVASGHTSSDLAYTSTSALVLNSGTIKDLVGNPSTLTLPAVGQTNSLSANKDLIIDTTVPTVTNVTSTSNDGSYKIGDVIPVTVTFSEVVNVVTTGGTPQLTLETGSNDAVVNYTTGTGTNTLTFNYTVVEGHTSTDLNYVATSSLALNSGTIKDAATNDATLTLPAIDNASSLAGNKALVIDGVTPTITSVTSTSNDGSYMIGDVVPITVTFSEVVNVVTTGGTPTLTLETGSNDAAVSYTSGTGTNTLTFNYTVLENHASSDLDYVATSSLALNSGTIKDGVGNDASLTLAAPGQANSLGANKALVIDGVIPTVTNVTATNNDGYFKASDVISITVTFSEAVNVVTTGGTPTLTLETGTNDAAVNYTSGTGTNTLTFAYTVASGHTSSDLDYVATSSLALNSGTIKDGAGNNATLTLATPGQANSLSANKALIVDTPYQLYQV